VARIAEEVRTFRVSDAGTEKQTGQGPSSLQLKLMELEIGKEKPSFKSMIT
jgi:hypothetical protein